MASLGKFACLVLPTPTLCVKTGTNNRPSASANDNDIAFMSNNSQRLVTSHTVHQFGKRDSGLQ